MTRTLLVTIIMVASCILMIRSAAAFAPRAVTTCTVVLLPQQRRSIWATFDDGLKKKKKKSNSLKTSSYDNNGDNIEQYLDGAVTTTTTTTSKEATLSQNSTTADVIPVVEYEQKKQQTPPNRRYDRLLEELGLNDGRLEHVAHLAPRRRVTSHDVFCNRELNMAGIRAVGFDMDYTLAQYKEPAFDRLAFDSAKEKLVYNLGYPKEVLDFEYDNTLWTRGLIIDTQRGNFLKIDRHKYVRVANHGFDRISSTTRKHLYSKTFNKVMSFSEKHFVNMDTLFQFIDAHLFASLITLKDKGEYEVLDFKTYEEIYRNVRECVDLCHRDGAIKDTVAKHPEKYIVKDNGLIPMLERYRKAGVKVFLLTNSYWEYTSTAMNYLYHGRKVSDERQKENEWINLFDLVVVGSCKPAYMLDPYLNLFRVNPRDGSLRNTDGVYEIDAMGPNGATKFLQLGKVFQGGNWLHLQAMLEINVGEEILYVGDHLYSDVLRSKRTLGWRSAFIMPELEQEMRVFKSSLPLARQIVGLRKLRDELSIYAEDIRFGQNKDDINIDPKQVQKTLESLQEQDRIVKTKLRSLAEQWHASFHPIWGAMFNAGYQDSRFAFYVENYACIYTSRASNLGLTSTERSFRTSLEGLPHDKLLDDEWTQFVEYEPWDSDDGDADDNGK